MVFSSKNLSGKNQQAKIKKVRQFFDNIFIRVPRVLMVTFFLRIVSIILQEKNSDSDFKNVFAFPEFYLAGILF